MNEYIQEYIDSIESLNTRKVLAHVFKKIKLDDIEQCNIIQFEQLIVDTEPKSHKEIITTIYVLSSYFK